jgi:hypothetical protein
MRIAPRRRRSRRSRRTKSYRRHWICFFPPFIFSCCFFVGNGFIRCYVILCFTTLHCLTGFNTFLISGVLPVPFTCPIPGTRVLGVPGTLPRVWLYTLSSGGGDG